MKNLLPFVFILSAHIATAQQHETFEYTRLSDSRQFKSDSHQIIFGDNEKSIENLNERRVTVNGDVYLFIVNQSKAGLIQEIHDPAGATIATVFLGGLNTNDIVSGLAYLKWRNIDTDNWAYMLNGKEVMRCSYHNSDNIQRVDLTYDSIVPFAAQLAAVERSLASVKYHDYSGREGKVQFGVKGGANISILSASINSESQFKFGMNAGFFFKAPIGKNAFFRPEIYYSSQGQKDKYTYTTGADAGETTTTLDYLNIPLLLEFGKTVTVQTGVQVGVLLSAREKGRITTQTVDDNLKEFMNEVDMSLVIGLGVNVTRKVNLGARYNIGVSNVFKDVYEPYPGLEFPNVKNRVFHFFVACSF